VTHRTLPIAIGAVVVLLGAAATATAASPDSVAGQRAGQWLESQSIDTPGQMADAIIALRAAGRTGTIGRRMDALEDVAARYAMTAGASGKVVLAAVAAGRNPRNLAGVDYVARITATYRLGRYGTSSYDQAYAMLALHAAGERVPAAVVRRLRKTRGAGGWGFSVAGDRDDVSSTGLLMEALGTVGVSPTDPVLRAAAAWLATQVNSSGGFNHDRARGPTQANATAIALRGWRATGRKPPSAWRRELRSLQEGDGGVRYTARVRESRVLATNDALLAFTARTPALRSP
jgi:hypothetical protein